MPNRKQKDLSVTWLSKRNKLKWHIGKQHEKDCYRVYVEDENGKYYNVMAAKIDSKNDKYIPLLIKELDTILYLANEELRSRAIRDMINGQY